MRRSRIALLALGGLLGLAFIPVLARALPKAPSRSVTRGCIRYPIVRAMYVCHDKVFVLLRGHLQYAGEASDLAPMPQPERWKRPS